MTKRSSVKLAPSILTANFAYLADEIRAAEAGGADILHLDVMDGRFVPNLTFGPLVIQAVRQITQLPLDVHLMIHEPDRYVADFVAAGANSLTVHVEACLHLHRTVQKINELGCRVGVALNPATEIEALREILPFIDMVLIMTVEPGFGGQSFLDLCLPKIRRTRQLLNKHDGDIWLQVDGGVSLDTIERCAEAGADVFVAGSAVFGADDPDKMIASLRSHAERHNHQGQTPR